MHSHTVNMTPVLLGALIASGWVLAGVAFLRTIGAL